MRPRIARLGKVRLRDARGLFRHRERAFGVGEAGCGSGPLGLGRFCGPGEGLPLPGEDSRLTGERGAFGDRLGLAQGQRRHLRAGILLAERPGRLLVGDGAEAGLPVL